MNERKCAERNRDDAEHRPALDTLATHLHLVFLELASFAEMDPILSGRMLLISQMKRTLADR